MKKQKIKIKLSSRTTILAAIRTSLSFIRTALACISVAFAFIKLDKAHPIDAFTVSLFVFCVLFVAGAVLTLAVTSAQVSKYEDDFEKIKKSDENTPLQSD